MTQLTLDQLRQACSRGGASVLTVVTELAPAAGEHAGVAPARYVSGSKPTYAFETRFVDGEPVTVTMLDQKASSINRVEDGIAQEIEAGDPLLCRLPRIVVTYPDRSATCYQLPHRAFDGHVRAGTVDGVPVTAHPAYVAARNCTAADARALLEMSPVSIVFGAWDSTRASHQVRFRSALVGEVIGVLADQSPLGRQIDPRGAARVDDISPSVRLEGKDMAALVDQQASELSSKNADRIRAEAKKGKGLVSGAALGLGSIPPSLDGLGLVSCRRIIRSQVLSFSALRQLRFGAGVEGDVACRVLLAALALHGVAVANEELLLRANCDLVEKGAPVVRIDGRNGAEIELDALTRDQTSALLHAAMEEASDKAGIRWEGQLFEITGNPLIAGGISADPEE